MYQKQIEQLVILQSVDDEIILLEAELEEAPRELAELETQLASIVEREEQMEEKTELLKIQVKKLEDEIEEDGHKVKKSKNKLMLVGNAREHHAMMREMDSLEKLNRMRVEERESVQEEMGRQEESMAAIADEKAQVQELYDAKKATLEERVAHAKKRLETLGRKRTKAGKAVPPPILGRYEFIRSRLDNPVIVAVTKGICGGCNIMIPPQIFNDLQKGKQILACPNCQRLIYWSEHVPAEEAVEAEAQAD